MREGIGSIALYNIIIIFIFVTFAILAGTMSYSKAFKSNSRIIKAIEKYEGYNELSAEEIKNFLFSVGYQSDIKNDCPNRRGVVPQKDLNPEHKFCVYAYDEVSRAHDYHYMSYGVVTYIYMDLPIVGDFLRIPIYGKSNRIFCFGSKCSEKVKDLGVNRERTQVIK